MHQHRYLLVLLCTFHAFAAIASPFTLVDVAHWRTSVDSIVSRSLGSQLLHHVHTHSPALLPAHVASTARILPVCSQSCLQLLQCNSSVYSICNLTVAQAIFWDNLDLKIAHVRLATPSRSQGFY